MKERGIVFNGAMVNAILEGCKTQERRVIKPQPVDSMVTGKVGLDGKITQAYFYSDRKTMQFRSCPYGKVGDRLWVKETFAYLYHPIAPKLIYKADYQPLADVAIKWKPSIHMKREESRINLKIDEIKVERLQDSSEEDAIAEGIEIDPTVLTQGTPYEVYNWIYAQVWRDYLNGGYDSKPIESLKSLWQSINGEKYPWESNPWVWCLSFQQV